MKASNRFLESAWSREDGQTVVLAALCMTLLMGFLALSVDVGLLFCAKRSAQTAADAAAIAGAQEIAYSDVVTAARADASRNGFTNGTNGVAVAVNNPPLNGPHAGNSGYVEVIVSASETTFFLNLFNQGTMTVEARAVSTMGATQNCVYALGSSGTDISVTNGVNVQFPSCALYGDSSGSTDLNVSGGATLNAAAIALVGNYSNTGGSHLTPTPATGIATISDPLAYLPTPSFNTSSCVANPNLGAGGTFTIGPASGGTICYNGLTISNGATATLRPGFYIVNGVFSLAGGASVSGSGVTIYFPPGGSVSLSNGINFTLSAPTSGTYNGILFYQSRSNTTMATIEGGASSTLQGVLYFPAANITFENGTSTTTYASIVSASLTFAGGATVKNYAVVNPASPLDSARLVE